jgi:nitroreductase
MALALTTDELLTTTRTVRRRLDLERPVDRSTVVECLRLGLQAPNGSNEQDWLWVVVDDPATRRALSALYRDGMRDFIAQFGAGGGHDEEPTPSFERIGVSFSHLLDHIDQVPVLLVPAIGPRYGTMTSFEQASRWGSILPAVWSFMLALRSRGLGSAWTTLHLYHEQRAAELLGIPYPEYTQAGLFPVAYTIGTDFRPADRARSADSIHWNRVAARG